MTERNQKAWMEIVKPAVAGLVALMAAATFYLQRTESTNVDARITAVEVEVKNIQSWKGKADGLLYEIRSDVSFIRGKMEAGK